MDSVRVRIGTIVSIIWLGIIFYLALRDTNALAKMTPNEWGDFLAGSFAPLAFLWLILGYLQQGSELHLSTEALRLQAEELKNSVQQQRELVEVTRQQVESERNALAFERRLREDLSEPKFSVQGNGGMFRGDGHSSYGIRITNAGHDATAFSAKINFDDDSWQSIMSYPLFSKGASYNASIERSSPLAAGNHFVILQYEDGLGRTVEKKFQVSKENDARNAALAFHPTA